MIVLKNIRSFSISRGETRNVNGASYDDSDGYRKLRIKNIYKEDLEDKYVVEFRGTLILKEKQYCFEFVGEIESENDFQYENTFREIEKSLDYQFRQEDDEIYKFVLSLIEVSKNLMNEDFEGYINL